MGNQPQPKHAQIPPATPGIRYGKRYLGLISLLVFFLIFSIFFGINHHKDTLIKEQLVKRAQALFQGIVVTRQWVSNHAGVYVKATQSEKPNPYLASIPSIKAEISDNAGNKFLLKNPAIVTREISSLAQKNSLFTFHITSLSPLNPGNTPDSFETFALNRFSKGESEYYVLDKNTDQPVFRYMAPLVTEESCLICHAQQGYQVGDIRGGISISLPAANFLKQIQKSNVYILLSFLGVMTLFLSFFFVISRFFFRDLRQAEESLHHMTTRDFLTNLLNRQEGLRRLKEEISKGLRNRQPLTILMLDSGDLAKVNATYGVEAIDKVQQELAGILANFIRDYDIIARYGSDEFLVILPATGLEEGLRMAQRLSKTIQREDFSPTIDQDIFIKISVNIGITILQPDESIDSLIVRASRALYAAKGQAENNIVEG